MYFLKGLKLIRTSMVLSVLLSMGIDANVTRAIALLPTEAARPESYPAGLEIAQVFRPLDDRQMHGQRQFDNRHRCGKTFWGNPPTALMPNSNLGLTYSPHPTLFFYVPNETVDFPVELILLDERNEIVYQTAGRLPNQAGITSFTFPPSVTLEPGQAYHWMFVILLDPYESFGGVDLYGWIEILADSAVSRFEASAPESRPASYAESGIWLDAIATLVALRQANPEDENLQAQWVTLLDSVGLGEIASEPLLNSSLITSEVSDNQSFPELMLTSAKCPLHPR